MGAVRVTRSAISCKDAPSQVKYQTMRTTAKGQDIDDADRAFSRFRRHGDPRDVARVFDVTAPRLILVATHLVRDTSDAEDLLQTTFLEAIQRAKTFETGRPVLPWLLTIMTRKASNRRRDRARRRTMSRGGEETVDPTPGPSEILEHKEILERVSLAVAGLSSPYREVLVLRLVHGLRPIEIAHALDRPAGSVHSQLHRGIEMLRKTLPNGILATVTLLAVSGRGLAGVRSEVVAAAKTASCASVALTTGGIMTMKKLLLFACALLVITFAGLWQLGDLNSPDRLEGDSAVMGGGDSHLSEKEGTAGNFGLPARHAKTARVPIQDPTEQGLTIPGSLLLRLQWRKSGNPARCIPVDVTAVDGRDPMFATVQGATDSTGRVLFAALDPGHYSFKTLGLAKGRAEVRPGEQTAVDCSLPEGISVDVAVVYPDDQPAARAAIWLYRGRKFGSTMLRPDFKTGRRVAVTDTLGRCQLNGLELSHRRIEVRGSHTTETIIPWIGARIANHPASPLRSIESRSENRKKIVLRVGTHGCTLQGLVVDASGHPIADSIVEVRQEAARPRRVGDGHILERVEMETKSDKHGLFALDSLTPGPVAIRARARGHAPHDESLTLSVDRSPLSLTIRLRRGAAITGTVRTKEGEPIPLAKVALAGRTVETGPPGLFRIDGIAAGKYDCRIRARGFRQLDRNVRLAAGLTETVDVVLDKLATVRGSVVAQDGLPLVGWQVLAKGVVRESHQKDVRATKSGKDAEFEIEVLPGQRYTLAVREPGGVGHIAFPKMDSVVGDGKPVTLSVPDSRRSTAYLTGYLVDQEGASLGAAVFMVKRGENNWSPAVEHDVVTGGFRIGPIPSGEWKLQIGSKNRAFPGFRSGPYELGPREERDLGRVILPPTGTIDAKIELGHGVVSSRAWLDLLPSEQTGTAIGHQIKLGKNMSAAPTRVLAGRYRVRLWGDNLLAIERSVAVKPNGISRVVLRPREGRRREVVLALPEGEKSAEVTIRTEDGVTVWHGELTSDQPTLTRHPVLGIGRNIFEAVGNSGTRYLGEAVVTVGDLAELRPQLRPSR